MYMTAIRQPLICTTGLINSRDVEDDNNGNVLGMFVYNRGTESSSIGKDEQIGEGVLFRVTVPVFDVVDELDESVRGSDGFGSTGN